MTVREVLSQDKICLNLKRYILYPLDQKYRQLHCMVRIKVLYKILVNCS